MCATLKGALKAGPGTTLTCGRLVGGKFVAATRRGRFITIDLTPPPNRQGKPGSERLVVAEVTVWQRVRRRVGQGGRAPAGCKASSRLLLVVLAGCWGDACGLVHSPGNCQWK